jgi:hypothetical protein
MEPAIIATIAAAVKILSPLFKDAAKELTKGTTGEIGKSIGSTAVDKAKELYETIRAKFSSSPLATESLTDISKKPDDPSTQAAFRAQLKEQLESDDKFAAKLVQLIQEADKAGIGAVFNTDVHGDVENLTNVGTVHGDLSIGNNSDKKS